MTVDKKRFAVIVINIVSVQNLRAPFCCALGKMIKKFFSQATNSKSYSHIKHLPNFRHFISVVRLCAMGKVFLAYNFSEQFLGIVFTIECGYKI